MSPRVEGRVPPYPSKVIPEAVRRPPILRPTAIGEVLKPTLASIVTCIETQICNQSKVPCLDEEA